MPADISKHKKSRPSQEEEVKGKRKRTKPADINIDGDNVNIGADVVGGNKIVEINNFYQSPPKSQRHITVDGVKKGIEILAKSRISWGILALLITLSGVLYWRAIHPLVTCPPENGIYTVLVAKFEPISTPERDISRFIIEDLTRKLTVKPLPINFTVCEYPRIIRSDEDALAVALANHADVIVWGNYTSQYIESKVQVGETSQSLIDHDILAKTLNVRTHMDNEQQDSVARQVIGIIDGVTMAQGNTYDYLQIASKLFNIDITNTKIVSEGVPGYVHNAFGMFLVNTPQALEDINDAISLDPANPLLYLWRATVLQRLGRFDESIDDAETASRLGPKDWTTPIFWKANRDLFEGNYENAIQYYTQIIDNTPAHWWPYTMRGYLWLRLGDLDKAKTDIDKSLDLKPAENWPYLWGVSIALRQGRLADAQQYSNDAFAKFPDPDAGEKWALLVASENKNPFTPILSAFWSWNLGQFNKAIQKAQSAEAVDPKFTDAYLVEGLSYCNLGKSAEAEAAYTKAIELEPQFALLYMLRADVNKQQGNMTNALGDFLLLQQSPQAPQMMEYIQAAQEGKINCKNFITYTP